MLEPWPRPFRGFLHGRGIAMGTEVSGLRIKMIPLRSQVVRQLPLTNCSQDRCCRHIIPTVTVCDFWGRKMNFTNSKTLVGWSLSRPTETQASRLLAFLFILCFLVFFLLAFLFIFFARTKKIKNKNQKNEQNPSPKKKPSLLRPLPKKNLPSSPPPSKKKRTKKRKTQNTNRKKIKEIKKNKKGKNKNIKKQESEKKEASKGGGWVTPGTATRSPAPSLSHRVHQVVASVGMAASLRI